MAEHHTPQQVGPEDHDSTDPNAPKTVSLPNVLSDQFGMATSSARELLIQAKIKVDGKWWEGDPLEMPYESVKDKKIEVEGPIRSVSFTYNG